MPVGSPDLNRPMGCDSGRFRFLVGSSGRGLCRLGLVGGFIGHLIPRERARAATARPRPAGPVIFSGLSATKIVRKVVLDRKLCQFPCRALH